MRPFQNLLVTDTDNAKFFESLFLSWMNSLIVPEWAQVWKSSWCHLRKCFSSTSFTILISWSPVCTPLISCHCHWKVWVMILIANATTNRSMKRGKSCKVTNIRVKGSERRRFNFIFRLNVVLCNLYQADAIVIETKRNGNKRFQATMIKNFIRVFVGVLEISIVSYRNCII